MSEKENAMHAIPAAIYLMMMCDAVTPEVRREMPGATPGTKISVMSDRQKHEQQSALRALLRMENASVGQEAELVNSLSRPTGPTRSVPSTQ